jgi:hypothetical protein
MRDLPEAIKNSELFPPLMHNVSYIVRKLFFHHEATTHVQSAMQLNRLMAKVMQHHVRQSVFIVFLTISAGAPYVVFGETTAAPATAEKPPYVTKESIDTTIQDAFLKFNQAAAIPGAVYLQLQAISDAKEIAASLKIAAKGDPNERYVLFRVGELENQIWLEEQDLEQTKREKNQKIINSLVMQFNNELAKKRPDFTVLAAVTDQMTTIDKQKADEVRLSLNDRQRNLSREVGSTIEKLLARNDAFAAQKELDYCCQNRAWLTVPAEKLKLAEASIQSQIDVAHLKKLVYETLDSADKMVGQTKFLHARSALQTFNVRMESMQKVLAIRDRNECNARAGLLSQRIEAQEDSLISANLAILTDRGIDAAIDYLEFTLRPAEILPEKIAKVDLAIRAVPIVRARASDAKVLKELDELAAASSDNGLSMEAVAATVQKRAQLRADSIRAIEAKNAQLALRAHRGEAARAERVRKKEEHRLARIRAAEEKVAEAARRKELKARTRNKKTTAETRTESSAAIQSVAVADKSSAATPLLLVEQQTTAVSTAKASVNQFVLAQNQELARRDLSRIYQMLDANENGAAYTAFQKSRDYLRHHLNPEVFAALKACVDQAYAQPIGP